MLVFNQIATPEELYQFLLRHISYGLIDKEGNIFKDSETDEFQHACKDWHVRSAEQILKDAIGHCYDFTEVERDWFEKNGYNFKTYWVCAHENGENGFAHAYLVYQDKENKDWVHFEVSDGGFRGLHRYRTLEEALKAQAEHQIECANKSFAPKTKYSVDVYEFNKPKENSTYDEYIKNATRKQV